MLMVVWHDTSMVKENVEIGEKYISEWVMDWSGPITYVKSERQTVKNCVSPNQASKQDLLDHSGQSIWPNSCIWIHKWSAKRGWSYQYSFKNAVVSASDEAALRQRNQHVKSIDEDVVLAWKRTSGWYRQSEVENMFFRSKNLIGDELKARG